MGGGNSSSASYVAPQAALNLLNQLAPWLGSRFSQTNPAYPGYFTSPMNPWSEIAGGGYSGMGQPVGLLAQANNLNSFLGAPSYGGYGYSPQYYNWTYPTQNPPYSQQGNYGTPTGMSNTNAAGQSHNGNIYDETSYLNKNHAYNPFEPPNPGGGGPGNTVPGYGPGAGGNTGGGSGQPQNNTYQWNWGQNTFPASVGGQDYTGQSSWLNQVPGMVGQGIGSANSLIAQLLGTGGGGGTIPHTAANAFEAMLTSKGWNDQPLSQAQSALAGLMGSSPAIWGNVSGNLNDIMATGAPVNVTPQWQQMTGAMDIARDKQLAQAAESYAAGNKRFGSGAANQFGNVAAEAAAQQNALLGQMTQNALEAAANRRLTATGQGAALGQMQAQLPIQQAEALLNSGVADRGSWANLMSSAANAAGQYGRLGLDASQQQWNNILNAAGMMGNLGIQGAQTLGNLGLNATEQQAQNAQQQWQNEMARLGALQGFGQQQGENADRGLIQIYSDWMNQRQNPYLPYAMQLAQIGSMVPNQQSQLPGAIGSGIGAYAALLPLLK